MRKIVVPLAALSLTALLAMATQAFATHPPDTTIAPGTFKVALYAAYNECTDAVDNATHSGVPGRACSFDTSAAAPLTSNVIKPGTLYQGWTSLKVINPRTSSVDVAIQGNADDVRCKTAGTGGCVAAGDDYNPDSSAGPYTTRGSGYSTPPSPTCTTLPTCSAGADMTATAQLPDSTQPKGEEAFRSADHYNAKDGVASCNTTRPAAWPTADTVPPHCMGTTQDVIFPVPIDCLPVTGTQGSSCGVNTTADALVPSATENGKRGNLNIGQIQVWDSGENGIKEYPTGDDDLASVQGLYIP